MQAEADRGTALFRCVRGAQVEDAGFRYVRSFAALL